MVSTGVSRTLRYLAGIQDDPFDSPEARSGQAEEQQQPSLLQQLGQGASDIGAGISSGLSSAASTVSSYLPDWTPSPPPESEPAPAPTVTPVSGWEAQKPIEGSSAVEEFPRTVEAVSRYLEPAGGAPRMGGRLQEINDQAARDQGKPTTDVRAMFTAADEPGWREANPELAAEYDDTQRQYGLTIMGQAGDAPRALGRAGLALQHAAEQGAGAARGVGSRVASALGANAENVAAADARMAAEGSVLAPAGLGALPGPGGTGRQTVEVLQDRLETATAAWQRARDAGDERMAALAREHAVAIESELADALNARRSLEPAITSDVGRRAETLPLAEETADTLAGAGSRRVDTSDLGGPMSVVPDMAGRMNATAGALPATRGAGALAGVNRALSEGLAGGVGGAVIEQGRNPDEDPRTAAARGFAAGAVGFPVATRLARGAARLAGAGAGDGGAGGALATLGAPGAGGAPQPGPGFFARFPGVQQAVAASQSRAAAMAARGQQPLGPLAWTGRFLESVGHSSMLGIRTGTTNLLGNVAEPIWSLPKEPARAVQRAIERGNPSALREPGEMAVGAAHGLWNAGGEMVDALAARGRYYSPDQPMLSQQTVNPFSHALATAAELGGRVVSALPDALFGSIARGAGEHREASQIATNAGLRGQPWKDRVSQILADRDAIMAGQPVTGAATLGGVQPAARRIADAQQAIKAGGLYAKDQTYQNELGSIGTGVRKVARLGDVPVVGKVVTPYFNTPWNAKLRLAERTPLGLAMNTTNRPGTMRTRFDKYYDAAAGSALIAGLVGGPAASGRITGSGPDDEGQRSLMRENGWLPNSTLVRGQDGQDYYVQNSKIPIFGPLLNVVGEIHDAAAYGKKDATTEQQLVGVARRFGKLFQSEAQLEGIADLLGAITDPAKNLRGYAGQLATRVTPYAATIRDISTSQDTQERQPDRGKQVSMGEEILGRWQQGTGQRSELPVKEGLRGPEENPSPGIWAFFPKASRARNDPVVQTFLAANVDIPRERTEVTVENKVPAAQRPPGQPSSYQVPLTPAQTRVWENARNRELVRLTETALRDPRWQQMAPGAQQQLLEGYVGASARVADTSILTRPEMQAATAQAIREQQTKASEQYRTGTR